MRLSLAAVAATVACAHAFKDTSPFLMFSSDSLPTSDIPTVELQSSTSVLSSTKQLLASCPSDIYLVLAQPSLLSSELRAYAHHLKNAASHSSVKARLSISEVVGGTVAHGGEIVDYIIRECGVQQVALGDWKGDVAGKKMVVNGVMPEIMGRDRKGAVEDNDAQLFSLFKNLPGSSYTVIYHTTPAAIVPGQTEKQTTYEASFAEPLHMDLKRNLWSRGRAETNSTDSKPLFEKYQFLSPGLFMGLLVSLLLLSILWVGISAISSLEVSYGAFDKEMGPAAQKKQQ
ncbi:hypothetical protein QTJ16_000849 [Diplocarpon rosae]|uniref:Protein BIG1 n=1 Tax=Diplocarpon rosae TaxID=946125 RepID=A0AAD9T757_9HELO|nr:hypothetical protein QTJ16_000849 [Diplocarpon rosae]